MFFPVGVLLATSQFASESRAEILLKYVQALAWPSVGLAIAVIFRDQVSSLIERVTTVETMGTKLEIAQKQMVQQVEALSTVVQTATDEVQESAIEFHLTREEMGRSNADPDSAEVRLRFARDLNDLRVQAHQSVSKLARMLGLERAYVFRVMNGNERPDLNTLHRIVLACNGDVEEWRRRWLESSGHDLLQDPKA